LHEINITAEPSGLSLFRQHLVWCSVQACSQGGESGCSVTTRNVQNVMDKHADQPAKNV